MGVPILAISGLPFGSLGTKYHLDVGPVERHIIYYKGEGGGFPQVRAVMSLVTKLEPTSLKILDILVTIDMSFGIHVIKNKIKSKQTILVIHVN
jgi:hypothetical protein